MKERVYLSDWAYNAGIIGFLNIMLNDTDIDEQDIIDIGNNYIEFERDKLDGFSDKFFKKAYEMYHRTDDILDFAYNLSKRIKCSELDSDLKKEVSQFKNRVESFTRLNQMLEEENINIPKSYTKEDALKYIQKLIKILIKNKDVLVEIDVKTYLGTISSLYDGKSFLNKNITNNLKEKFKNDFEEPILKFSSKEDKKHICVFCGKRQAKKGAMFDTGLVSFLGANKDNKNFFWNFNPKLPICEICELIYFCIFAGLTEFRINNKFYFVDKNTSVKELYNANKLFSKLMAKEGNFIKERGILNFINDYVLLKLTKESEYSLANISFIEIDLTGIVKVYGFNLSKQKAEYIISNKDKLEKLVGSNIKIKNTTIYLFSSFIQHFLSDTLSYGFLANIERLFIGSVKPNSQIQARLSAYRMQLLNILIHEYIQKNKKGGIWMDDRELWSMYYQGQKLKKSFYESDSRNKINPLAYRLISALRISDINTFMNLIIRTYMSMQKEVPALFVKCMNDNERFCALGYSFVNGLLSQEREEIEEEVDSDE